MAYYSSDLIDAMIGYPNSHEEFVGLVKSGRFDLNRLDASNRTPLYHLANECSVSYKPYVESDFKDASHIGKARTLLNHGADPNIKDRHGWTIIHQCAVNGNLPLLQLCVQRGGRIDEKNSEGKLPLDLAVLKRHEPLVEYIEKRSCDLKAFCRLSIRAAMGRRTYNRINDLPLPPSLKLYVNYYNPYPGFMATVFVPRPWSEEEILSGAVEKTKVKEFFEENASEQFNTEKNTGSINSRTGVEDLVAMMEALYFWESFKAIEYREPLPRPPRYSMEQRRDESPDDDQDHQDNRGRCRPQ